MDDDSLYTAMNNYIANLENDLRNANKECELKEATISYLEGRLAEQGRLLSILTEQSEAGFVH